MYKLYTRPGSGGFVVEAALALANAPFEQIDVPKTDRPDPAFLDISPLNQVPVLTLPDGSSMTESAAICILLAERHPNAGLAPAVDAPARADFLRWMAFMSSVLYPAVLRFYYAYRYTADADGTKAVKQAAVAEMDRGFAVVDAALQAVTGWSATACRWPTSISSCWWPGIPMPTRRGRPGPISSVCGRNCARTR